MVWFIIWEAAFLLSSAYALLKGGAPERIMAAGFLIISVASVYVLPSAREHFHRIEPGMLLVDGMLLALMIYLLIRANRLWPIPMSAMQAIPVMEHIAMLLGLNVDPRAYYQSVAIWSVPQIVLLAVATWKHRARLTQIGADPSWRSFSARSTRVRPATGPTG